MALDLLAAARRVIVAAAQSAEFTGLIGWVVDVVAPTGPLGVDEPPYDELYGYIKALDEDGLEDAASPLDVTAVIVEAIESDDPPLRMPVGEECEEAVRKRRQLDDREWEQLVDEHRSFTW